MIGFVWLLASVALASAVFGFAVGYVVAMLTIEKPYEPV